MKKRKLVLKNIALLAFVSLGFIACERDFAEIGTDIVGEDNFNTTSKTYPVITYNKRVTPVQSSNLTDNLLGYYFDPNFGSTTANFIGQLTPKVLDPSFGDNIVLDSVVLTVPYYSKASDIDDDGFVIYDLDSIYGSDPIKLTIHRNNYFLRDFDPNEDFNTSQKYYSNGSSSESDLISDLELEGEILYQDLSFTPDSEVIVLKEIDLETGEEVETSRLIPSLRVKLNNPNDFWENLILNREGEPELTSQNNFHDHFRGLYIKAESLTPNGGTLMQLDFASENATLKIHYTSDNSSSIEGVEEIQTKSNEYEMSFSGTRVNILDNNFDSNILSIINNANTDEGDEKLYIKGGEGSMAIIDLFTEDEEGNTFNDYMNEFRDVDEEGNVVSVKRLVNEAFIEFYVDQEQMQVLNGEEPNRIYVYDINNNSPIIDYFLDLSVSTTSSNAVLRHLEPLTTTEETNQGVKYKVRITEHINNLILKDSTNVKLGLVVASNIREVNNYDVLTEEDYFNKFPSGTILSPRSTILHGNNSPDEDKKVKLKIYYTEPNN